MVVLGTRPEVIKSVSFIRELFNKGIKPIIVNTGQHIDLTNQMLSAFKLTANYNLKIMQHKQSLSKILKNVLNKLDVVVRKEKPDIIVVLGDTNTSLGAALVAYYNQIPILHIEGGIRSYNKYDAYPEEGNRIMIDHIADWNSCQTQLDVERLKKENIHNAFFAGNNSLDIIKEFIEDTQTKKQVLITMHRREGWGLPMKRICLAIKELALSYPDHTFIIVRHPNPIVFDTITEILGQYSNIQLLDTLPFDQFIRLMVQSKIIMTDSGGMVQEAIFLRKPIIYLREKSEYEYLFDGTYLVSVNKDRNKIIESTKKLLDMENPKCRKINDFGNGTAGKKIVEWILNG